MKKVLFTLVLLLPWVLFAQEWLNYLPNNKTKKELTFYDYQKAFKTFETETGVINGKRLVNGEWDKVPGWKQFKRWEWDMQGQIDRETGKFPEKTAQQVYDEYLRKNPQFKNVKTSTWTSLGPNSSAGGIYGIGRINCIAFHPTDNNSYWVGAPSGGLWHTTDNGASWTCLTDKNAVLGISDIAIPSDYETSKVIYIATGDRDGFDNNSVGVLKSSDGGVSWDTTGISFTLSMHKHTSRILIDPNDNNTLIASTTDGIFKTSNGGVTWNEKICPARLARDMEYKPGDFNTLYVYGSEAIHSALFVSSDGGVTWSKKLEDIYSARIELAVTPANDAYVYAISGSGDVFKSIDSGLNFTKILDHTTLNLLGWGSGSDEGNQSYYDLTIAISPTNADLVLVGGINTWRSEDGGTSWTMVNHWRGNYGVQAVHADKHMLKYHANGNLFECNDGGVYISANNGTTWTDKSNGIAISQIYRVGLSQTNPDEIIAGLQDCGTKLISESNWEEINGGDGMNCIIDYSDINIQYSSSQNGRLRGTTNHWLTDRSITPLNSGGGSWITPYIIDPNDPNTLYAGFINIWKTSDRGNNWIEISNIDHYNAMSSMAIAPSNTEVLYVSEIWGTWKTSNGGTSWEELSNAPFGIESIAVKNDDENTVWISVGEYDTNAVFESTDGGSTWTNISAGLPELPAYSVIQNKQITSEVHLYVGTELGVYMKLGNQNWLPYNTGLPKVKVRELEIYYDETNPSNSKLRAATYGRGLWESDLTPVITEAPVVNFEASESSVFQDQPITFTDKSTNSPYLLEWTFEGGTPPSSTDKITTIRFSTPGVYDIGLTATNSIGSDTLVKKDYITIKTAITPIADFTMVSATIYEGQAVQFSDASENTPLYWDWTFSGGSPETSKLQNPSVIYENPGTYDVSLTAINRAGSHTKTKTGYVEVIESVKASFSASPMSGSFPLEVTFTNTSAVATSFEWDFGDGSAISTDENPVHIYTQPGMYSVSLKASDGTMTDEELLRFITVKWPKPIADFTATPLSGIDPLTVSFSNASENAQSYNWDFGDETSSSEVNPVHVFTKGSYSVTLNATNPSGTDAITKQDYISVDPNNIPDKWKGLVRVYPNPAKDFVLVSISNEKRESISIELIDLQGKILALIKPEITEKTIQKINTSNLQTGSYILRVSVGSEMLPLKIAVE